VSWQRENTCICIYLYIYMYTYKHVCIYIYIYNIYVYIYIYFVYVYRVSHFSCFFLYHMVICEYIHLLIDMYITHISNYILKRCTYVCIYRFTYMHIHLCPLATCTCPHLLEYKETTTQHVTGNHKSQHQKNLLAESDNNPFRLDRTDGMFHIISN